MKLPFRLRRAVFYAYRKIKVKKHTLDYLFWECTLRCSLNCLHCGSDCTKSGGEKEMSVEDFSKVLDDIKKRNKARHLTVCMTGGEPLLRKDLEDAGREIIKRGFHWGIVTNAFEFTPGRFLSLVKAGMTSMSFSIDGFQEEHSYLRQNPDSFSRVMSAVKTVLKFQSLNPGYFVFDVITCVHKGNIKTLRRFRDFLIDSGIKMWRIFSIFPEGRAEHNNLSLSREEYVFLMDFIAETRGYKNSEGKSIHLNYSCEGYLGKYELKVRDYFFFCRAGVNIASVWCDGNVSGCLSVRSPFLVQGNIYKEKFMDIWNRKFRMMRNHKWAKKGKCRKCGEWRNCLGNGMHLHKDAESGPCRCNYEILNLN